MEIVGGTTEQGLPGEREREACFGHQRPCVGGTTHVLLCVGDQQEYLENVPHNFPGGSRRKLVFPAAAGAEPEVFFGRCRIGTKNEKEVGSTMRTFMGPHKA